jgi:hypothetical protein
VLLTALAYVLSAAAIGAVISRQGTRQDSEAEILGVARPRRVSEVLVLVFCSAILALFPAVVVFFIFGD